MSRRALQAAILAAVVAVSWTVGAIGHDLTNKDPDFVVPADVHPTYTPFTHVPTKPVRQPVPSTAYYPPGYVPSPGR